jgi:hypothetical protein
MNIVEDKLIEPKFPPCRFITDGILIGGICDCGSSKKLFSKKCFQPNCENYYKGFPSKDLDINNAVYVNKKLIFSWRFE